MWFKLATADFTDKNLGTMADIAGSWSVSYTIQGGISKNNCPTSVKMNDGKTQAAADFTATFTLADGATLTSITATLKSTGATLVTETSTTSITIPAASITGDIAIAAIASSSSTGDGGNEGDSGNDDTTTGILTSATLLTETAVNTNSATTFANSSFYSYKDIPVTAGNVYSIPGARNCYVTNSSGQYIGGVSAMLNQTASGGVDTYHDCPSTIVIPSGAAYLSYCAKPAEVAAADAESLITIVSNGQPLAANNIVVINDSLQGHNYTSIDVNQYFTVIGFTVTAGKEYNIPYGRNYMFIDSSGALVSSGSGAGSATATVAAPTNAAYLHVSYKKSERTVSNWSIIEI